MISEETAIPDRLFINAADLLQFKLEIEAAERELNATRESMPLLAPSPAAGNLEADEGKARSCSVSTSKPAAIIYYFGRKPLATACSPRGLNVRVSCG